MKQPFHRTDPWLPLLLLILGVGGVVRGWLLPSAGFEYDMADFRRWAEAAAQGGLGGFGRTVTCNYMPLYPQVLQFLGFCHRVLVSVFGFGDDALSVLLKLPANLADLVTAWIVYRFAMSKWNRRVALGLLALVWLNPAFLLTSAVWGQIDSVLILFSVAALIALERERYFTAFLFLGLALMIKLQAVVFLPVFVAAVLTRTSRHPLRIAIGRSILGFGIALVAANLHFLLVGNGLYVWHVIRTSIGWHPLVSLGAHNIWWILFGPRAMDLWDGFRWLGTLSYRDTGLLLILGLFGSFAILMIWPRRFQKVPLSLSGLAFLFGFTFCMFPTQMHERYLLYALPPLLLFGVTRPRALWIYGLLSLGAFLTIGYSLQRTFPDSAPILQSLFSAKGGETRAIAIINILVWGMVAIDLSRRVRYKGVLLSITVLPLLVGFGVARFDLEREGLPLSEIRPQQVYQEFRQLHHNVSVSNRPLSVEGREFARGLGTHARSRIVYEIGDRYSRLTTGMGVDDAAASENRVQFQIVGDDRLLFDSGPVTKATGVVTCEVDLKGVQNLELRVDSGGDGIEFDHADWLDPRLHR